jgi:uncharacterized protein (DUF58 family)
VTTPAWDAEVLARIAHLHLRARQAVAGWRSGDHRSIRTNANVEFVDYKEYSPGDPIRHLDWKVAARADKLVIKRHAQETEVPVTLVVDASGDLGTGGKERPALDGTKHGAAVTLAATLAVFLKRRGDPVGLQLLAGEGSPWTEIPPRSSSGHLAQIIGALASVQPAGEARLGAEFERMGERLPRRGVVVLISDLMEEPDSWGPRLAALSRRGTDLRVIHLYDRVEWGMDWKSPSQLFSPEGGTALAVDPSVARPTFAAVVEEYLQEVQDWLGRHNAHYVCMAADTPADQALASVLRGEA